MCADVKSPARLQRPGTDPHAGRAYRADRYWFRTGGRNSPDPSPSSAPPGRSRVGDPWIDLTCSVLQKHAIVLVLFAGRWGGGRLVAVPAAVWLCSLPFVFRWACKPHLPVPGLTPALPARPLPLLTHRQAPEGSLRVACRVASTPHLGFPGTAHVLATRATKVLADPSVPSKPGWAAPLEQWTLSP